MKVCKAIPLRIRTVHLIHFTPDDTAHVCMWQPTIDASNTKNLWRENLMGKVLFVYTCAMYMYYNVSQPSFQDRFLKPEDPQSLPLLAPSIPLCTLVSWTLWRTGCHQWAGSSAAVSHWTPPAWTAHSGAAPHCTPPPGTPCTDPVSYMQDEGEKDPICSTSCVLDRDPTASCYTCTLSLCMLTIFILLVRVRWAKLHPRQFEMWV